MPDIAQITQYFNIGLLVLFLLIAIGLFLAGLRGFVRGVWKSTHNMVFMLSLVLIAFFTLNVLTDFIGSFDISMFWKGTLYITRTIDGSAVTYYVPITSVKETLTELIKGFYTLYNVSASASSAANFALALTGSILKIIVFIVEMLLIVTLGNFFSFLSWYIIFQHFIPRIARKLVKLRWVGMLETATTFLVVTFLFMTPFTSLVNSLNQSYQHNRPKTDNQLVVNIGNFVDAYNQSLFAQILFNWTVDGSGMTLDTRLFNTLTTSVSGEYSIGLIGEFANLTNIIVTSADGLSSTGETEVAFDPTSLITKDVIDLAFDSLINSGLVTSVLPVVIDIAMNSDILAQYIPNRLVDLSDVDWSHEIGYVKDMVDCIFDSGAVDRIFVVDEQGHKTIRSFQGNDLFNFIDEIVYADDFNRILDVFKSIDQSKVLSRVVPAVIQFAINTDTTGSVKNYLPFSWEELNELSWGFETYILFDFLHATVELDRDFLKAIFVKTGAYTPAEGETIKTLPALISEHVDGFKELLVGKIVDGQLVNVDKHGQTIVFRNGQRIVDESGKERNYCLFDMSIMGRVMPTLLDGLFDSEALSALRGNMDDDDLEPFHEAVKELDNGTRLKNYKLEFDSILDVIATVAKDEPLLDAIMTNGNLNSLMSEEGNFFSIDQTHISYFKSAIGKMDKSSLLYSVLAPILKSLLSGNDVANTMNDLGLKADVLVSAIDHDIKRPKENRQLFSEFASILDRWGDLNTIYSMTKDTSDSSAMMEKLKDEETINALVRILKTLHNNRIINPIPEQGDLYEENENLYGLLEHVFSLTESLGLSVTRDTLREVETPTHSWDDEFDAIGRIFQFIATNDIMNAADAFSGGLTRDVLWKLKESGEGNYNIPGLFAEVDGSYIFSSSLGPFLDNMFGDSLNGFLIDKGENVTFENITSWTNEGQSIKNLLDSLYKLLPVDDDEAKDFFSNFDLSTLDKVVDLNAMLHDLAHSGIFTYIDEHGVSHYQFGQWLYGKIDSTMGSFSVNSNDYDLLADPNITADHTYSDAETWGTWGTRPEDDLLNADKYFFEWKEKYNSAGTAENTHYIAYKDFVYANGMANDNPNIPAFWCDYEEFQQKQNEFLLAHESDLTNESTYLNNDWGAYYASDDFLNHYSSVFDVDEISRVVKFISYAMRLMQPKKDNTEMSFNKMESEFLNNMLGSINDTCCLRICSYNFYRIAAENIFNSYESLSLSSAYNIYMVNAGLEMYDFANAHDLRAEELSKLVTLYQFVNDANDAGVFDSEGKFDYEKLNDDAFIVKMKNALKQMNESYVFHRNGSAKVDQLTVFQSLFNTMLGQSGIKDMIYLGDNSPKDHEYIESGVYNDVSTKVKYLVTNTFLTDDDINDYIAVNPGPSFDDMRDKQFDEVDSLLDSIKKIYSLKDSGGNSITNFDDADMKNADNRTVIYDLLNILNQSELLFDLVPNTIYKLFIDNDTFSITSSSGSVDFKRVDPFYHYYYTQTLVKRSSVNFEARYLSSDIDGIYNLLGDYQEYDELVGSGEINKRTTLKALAGTETAGVFESNGVLPRLLKHLHGCNLFHTPARNHDYAIYYTNKFDGDGFTLFEEMVSKVCSFVQLDELMFDSTYDPAHNPEYTSASAKLTKLISAITQADDTGVSTNYYHTAKGQAWNEEIDAIMHLAYSAADVGTGEYLDTSVLELSTMPPESIKKLLTIVNYSDLVSDSVPNLVSKGFEAINLGTQSTYESVNYAYYHLNQAAYGGVNGDSPAGTEIDNIYNIMASLAQYDSESNFTGYATNMNNMNDFIKNDGSSSGLEGLLRYLYDSRIFNTSLAGNYNEYNTVDGRQITAQGVLLYNSFNAEASRYILSYVARDADPSTPETGALDKIAVFSKILHMKGNYVDPVTNEDVTYRVESAGLKKLINLTDGNLTATTFTTNTSISNVEAHRGLITGIIECAYNATGDEHTLSENWQRSCLVSEIVSGLFNNILENQYNKLVSERPTYQFETFSFAEDDASLLTFNSYSSLNEVEKNGLDGILDCVKILGTSGTNYIQMKAKAAELEQAFVKMGADSSHNSEIARAVYLSEAHSYFLYLRQPGILVDNSNQPYNPVNELSKNHEEENNVYSNSFSFAEYGHRTKNFLDEAHLAI